MTAASRRLGILGGTFDPIHMGHLDAAEAARAAMQLDEILVIPSRTPPHRPHHPHASSYHRFAMAALAVAGRAGYRASDLELRREGPSYSSQTLAALHTDGWPATRIYFILGADAFADIGVWYDYPRLLDACHFVVIERPGITLDSALQANQALAARVMAADAGTADPSRTAIFPVRARTSAVSSSEIRRRLWTRQSVDGLMPAAVASHIEQHHLYRAEDDLHGQD